MVLRSFVKVNLLFRIMVPLKRNAQVRVSNETLFISYFSTKQMFESGDTT